MRTFRQKSTSLKSIRDYFYVEDGAIAYMLLAEKLAAQPELKGRAFNFSNESHLSVSEMVAKILKAMGSRLEPEIRNEASHEIREQYLDASRARNTLGWSPMFTLDEGLATTIDWYRDFLKA